MEIRYYGGNCVKISGKRDTIVTDDNLDKLGLKKVSGKEDLLIYTFEINDLASDNRFVISGPGEYEISGTSVLGIPARANMDSESDGQKSTIYRISLDGFNIALLGHIYPELSDEQLEKIGVVDLLIIPVGGNGYTVDAHGAAQLIKVIEPRFVIPTHFSDPSVKYEVPQAELEIFLKEMGLSEFEKIDHFKMTDIDSDNKTNLIVLNRL